MSSSLLDPEHTFASLSEQVGLDVRLRKAVARLGHARPTLVQSQCLAIALQQGRDLLVRARTGSGKTLAYCLPVLQKLLHQERGANKTKGIGAVILVPSKELCAQVHQVLQQLTYYCDDVISVAVLSAGIGSSNNNRNQPQQVREDLERQEALLRDQPDVVIATPSALLTHIRRNQQRKNRNSNNLLDLKSSLQMLVVDEADLVLSFGYSQDLAEIVKVLPRIYHGMLLSATLSAELDSLKKIVLHSPVVLKLEQENEGTSNDTMQNRSLKQFFLAVPGKDKRLVLYVFLKLGLLKGKGLFFVNTTDAGYRLKLFLEQFHIRSAVLNAELPFRSRLNIIEQFNVGNFDYLIATDSSTDVANTGGASKQHNQEEEEDDEENDVEQNMDKDESDHSDSDKQEQQVKQTNSHTKAPKSRRKNDEGYGVARGLDFRNVSFVVNVDLPPSAHSYAHRVGRTARGGANGVALTLVDVNSIAERQQLAEIQESQPSIPLAKASTDHMQAALPSELREGGGGLGDRDTVQKQRQPVPLDFDLQEIEGFRYRVEDVGRAVTKTAVRETRASELQAEVLNSERLRAHFFDDRPADLQLLAHDRISTHNSRVQDHLKHVPKYLLPRGMHVADLNRRKRKKKSKANHNNSGERRSDNDPLQNFDADVNLDGVRGTEGEDGGDDAFAEFLDDGDDDGTPQQKKQKCDTAEEKKIFTSTRDGTGRSTAGRTAWKEKHKKGKFSGKKRLAERKYKQPLGI